jgi:hypothetical protein
VWVFSYSNQSAENALLLNYLKQAGVAEVVYVSSSSTIVCNLTACYKYPRIKHHAELQTLNLPNAKVLTIGLMFDELTQLPAGTNVATRFEELAEFIHAPSWPSARGRRNHLLRVVHRPFQHTWERWAYRGYGFLMQAVGCWPCVLRPVDFLLRALGARWYGYVYLSNKLWISTIS